MAKPTPAQNGRTPADASAPPFATRGGKPVPVGPGGANPNGLGAAPPQDEGGPGWDIDQSEVPQGGTVLRADPPTGTSGGGGLGNGGNSVPFKNLK